VGAGIRFTPNAGLTSNASFVVKVPLVNGGGSSLKVSVQVGKTSGNNRVAIRDDVDTAFTSLGTISLYAGTAAQRKFTLPITDFNLQPGDDDTMFVQFTLVSKDRNSSSNLLNLDSVTFFYP
jgi:hypothetical protein